MIVVDGGSKDDTAARARRAGAAVVAAPRGRGSQLNVGAARARGDALLFLHADSRLPEGWRADVAGALAGPDAAGSAAGGARPAALRKAPGWGCFETIAVRGVSAPTAWAVARGVALRTRLLHRPYGDQAFFVRRRLFEELGGFDSSLPLLEDVELAGRLRARAGAPAVVPRAVATSGRRWRRLGLLRTALVNQAVLAGRALGVEPQRLAAFYYARRGGGGGARLAPH